MSFHPKCRRRERECGRELKIEIGLRRDGGMSIEERPFCVNGALKKRYGEGKENIYKQRESLTVWVYNHKRDEAERPGVQGQPGICSEFKAYLSNLLKPCLRIQR